MRQRVVLLGLFWLSVHLVFAPSLVVEVIGYLRYRAAFNGICVPDWGDIPAYSCSYDQYMSEFRAGFNGIGAILLHLGLMSTTATTLCGAWLVGLPLWLVLRGGGWDGRAFLAGVALHGAVNLGVWLVFLLSSGGDVLSCLLGVGVLQVLWTPGPLSVALIARPGAAAGILAAALTTVALGGVGWVLSTAAFAM